MPSHRKRPTPQPARRPQVAGLRRPGTKPSPRPHPAPYSAQHEDLHTDQPAEVFDDPTSAPSEIDDTADTVATPEPVVDDTVEDAAVDDAVEVDVPTDVEAEPLDADAAEAASRPTPRSKARDTGALRPTSEGEVEVAPALEDDARLTPRSAKSDAAPFWIAVTLAVLLAAGAGVFGWLYFSAGDVSDNKAQVDAMASNRAEEEISAAVQTLFSYDYTKLKGRDEQVNDLLASDKLRKQFATLNCAVEDQAPKQQLSTASRVSYAAITDMRDDTAKAMVFVESVWERKSTKQRDAGAAALGVTAKLVGDSWKITDINFYDRKPGAEPGVPAKCK